MSKGGKAVMAVRASSRVSTLSKGMRVVDSDTRRDHLYRRITQLESDNYNEDKGEEDAYDDNSEDEAGGKVAAGKKRRVSKGGGAASGGALEAFRLQLSKRKVKSLERLIVEHGYTHRPREQGEAEGFVAYPNYTTVSAEPSVYPQRHFCSGCGQRGSYACTRCGLRTCSVKCSDQHKESRCLQMH